MAAALFVHPVGARPAGDVAVYLRPEAEVAGGSVALGDVAEVAAPSADQQRRLEAVPLCFAPLPGAPRDVTRDYVLRKLRQEGVDLSRVRLAGAEHVHIVTASSRIPGEAIRRAVLDALLEAIPWAAEDTTITPPRTLGDLVVPGRAPTLRVTFADDEAFLGSTLARVHVYAAGGLVQTASYRFHIGLERDVYVAHTRISRGTIVEPGFVRRARVTVTSPRADYLVDPDLVFGQRARRSLRPGTRLTRDMLEAPPLVDRGDRVRVKILGAQFEISTVGKAQEAGALGSVIRIDLPTKRRVYARVSGPGRVTLEE